MPSMPSQRAALFSEDGKTFDAAPFLRAIETGDLYSKKAAATILALLFQARRRRMLALRCAGLVCAHGLDGRSCPSSSVHITHDDRRLTD